MEANQIELIERRLIRERDKILRSLDRFRERSSLSRDASDSDLSSYSFHMADQGTDAMERETGFLFASKEGRYLYRIEEALRRLYDDPGKFGACPECVSGVHAVVDTSQYLLDEDRSFTAAQQLQGGSSAQSSVRRAKPLNASALTSKRRGRPDREAGNATEAVRLFERKSLLLLPPMRERTARNYIVFRLFSSENPLTYRRVESCGRQSVFERFDPIEGGPNSFPKHRHTAHTIDQRTDRHRPAVAVRIRFRTSRSVSAPEPGARRL